MEKMEEDAPFPFPDPRSPATLPAILKGTRADGRSDRLVLDHWGDETCRDPVKFWGGAAGYPGAALARDAIDLVRDRCGDAASDSIRSLSGTDEQLPIGLAPRLHPHRRWYLAQQPQGKNRRCRLPARRDLCCARPWRRAAHKACALLSTAMVSSVHADAGRACRPPPRSSPRFSCAWHWVVRIFHSHVGPFECAWVGLAKEGQARAITTVTEETTR